VRVCAERRAPAGKGYPTFSFREARVTRVEVRSETKNQSLFHPSPSRDALRCKRDIRHTFDIPIRRIIIHSSPRDASSQTIRSGPARTPPCAPRW
jgi:hypothetical protein